MTLRASDDKPGQRTATAVFCTGGGWYNVNMNEIPRYESVERLRSVGNQGVTCAGVR